MPTTLQSVVDRITLDYLVRTDLNAATVRAVQAAIRRYERKRWPWNETVTTLTASNGVATLSVPSDFLVLDLLEVQFQSSNYALVHESLSLIRQMNAVPGGNSLPVRFDQRGYTFELSPVPDSAYLLNCYYLKRLTELTSGDMTASNDWLSAAEDLIVYHATKLMWANVLRNTEEAGKYAQLERDAYNELKSYTEQRIHTGLKPTSF
jgi:hypothetical protein